MTSNGRQCVRYLARHPEAEVHPWLYARVYCAVMQNAGFLRSWEFHSELSALQVCGADWGSDD